MNKIYDFIVIGAGISACTFASSLNKRFSDASILLIEQGRRIGGRSTTRKSRNKIFEFDQGLPSLSFSKDISKDIQTLISPLIQSKKLVDISNDILAINEFGLMNKALTNCKVFRSLPFMINFCEEIINQSINPNKINFSFQTLTKSIKRNNELWEVEVNNAKHIKSKNLILSSSLIAHPRCLKILQINSLPLSDAFIPGNDELVDSLIRLTKKQNYIKRKVYILCVSKSEVVKNFGHQYLQLYFSTVILENLNFEKIIFQEQSDGSIIIALHCRYLSHITEINIDIVINDLTRIFHNYKNFVDLFLQARLIDKMYWRSSQPLNNFLPKELQWSSISKIGFCGDWFDFNGTSGVESAMNNSIRLSKLLDWN